MSLGTVFDRYCSHSKIPPDLRSLIKLGLVMVSLYFDFFQDPAMLLTVLLEFYRLTITNIANILKLWLSFNLFKTLTICLE